MKGRGAHPGMVLGIIMLYFFTFSLLGLLAMTMAERSRLQALKTIQGTRNAYALESTLNLALWRLNQGPSSLGSFQHGAATATYTPATMLLSLSTDRWQIPATLQTNLELDHVFKYTCATMVPLDTTDPSLDFQSANVSMTLLDSLPVLDTTYYASHAVNIYQNGAVFNGTLTPGIHYVRHGDVELKNNTYLEGTLLVFDILKVVGTNVHIRAGTDSLGNLLPALIVADSVTTTDITDITIEGAIISYGHFEIKQGWISGPFIGTDLEVQGTLTIDDQGSDQYYTNYPGFGVADTLTTRKIIKRGSWR